MTVGFSPRPPQAAGHARFVVASLLALVVFPATIVRAESAVNPVPASTAASAQPPLTDTVRDAYVWGYPTVDLYSILRSQSLDRTSREFKAPLNAVGHARNVATPDDTAIIAPNVDTPYSYAWLDLRAEPVVITVPAFEPRRYVSLQLVDLYTWIIGYATPRTNGAAGGDFLIAPTGWRGAVPKGIRQVFYSPTTLALGLIRTQLFDAADLPRVHALQDQFRVRTLSEYVGRKPRSAGPMPPLVPAINLREQPATPEFFTVLNWMLQFMPELNDEQPVRRAFASIGVMPGAAFAQKSPDDASAVVAGMRAGLAQMQQRAQRVRSSAEIFGSREQLGQDYVTRAAGAMLGILGNSAEEFLGVGYVGDSKGRPFDGRYAYQIHFAPDALPPVGAFWSITVYTPQKLLHANAMQRYVINSPMLPSLARDPEGGFTLYVQHESPGAGHEANWLPVPDTAFGLTFRTYLPGEEIRNGKWRAPPVARGGE